MAAAAAGVAGTNLKGKVAVVTGGGTGIGRATVLQLAEAGASVAINYSRSAEEAEQTAREAEERGGSAITLRADVSDDREVGAMIAAVTDKWGRLDILVNNAGMTRPVALTDLDGITDDDFDTIFGVNVRGLFYCCRAAIPHLRTTGGGHIVNVASVAGIGGTGSSLVYSASKGAVITLTRGLAASQAPEIQVNAVAPGVVDTRWTKQMRPETLARVTGAIAMGRVAQPDDVAQIILGLLASDYVTGEVVTLAGGRTQ